MSICKVILIGNVGNDPEIRTINNGNEVATFSLATTENWKDKSGEKQSKTEWHRIVSFNPGLVGIIKQYVNKGTKLYIEGSIQYRKWTDEKTGVEKYATDIVLNGFNSVLQMLGNKGSGGGGMDSKYYESIDEGSAQSAPVSSDKAGEFVEEIRDDIPF